MSRRLTRRTWAALAILLLAIPALMAVFVCVWDERKYYLTSLLLVGLMFVPFVLRFEGRRPQARELVLLSTMTALAVAGRAAFLLAAAVQARVRDRDPHGGGLHAGGGLRHRRGGGADLELFLRSGTVDTVADARLRACGLCRRRAVFGAQGAPCAASDLRLLSVFVLYGVLLDTASMLMYNAAPSWQLWLATCASGVVFNLIHACSTALFLLVLYKPLLSKLARVKEKYGLLE